MFEERCAYLTYSSIKTILCNDLVNMWKLYNDRLNLSGNKGIILGNNIEIDTHLYFNKLHKHISDNYWFILVSFHQYKPTEVAVHMGNICAV